MGDEFDAMIRREYQAMVAAQSLAAQRFHRTVAAWVDGGQIRQGDIARALEVTRETVRLWARQGREG